MEELRAKIKKFCLDLAEKGIPIPLCRDMATNTMSITYTMLIVSFTLAVLAQFGLFNLDSAKTLELLSYTGVGYLGRQWQKSSSKNEQEQKENT